MLLTVLGSGTLVPNSERGTPGFALSADDTPDVLMFDGGSGTLGRMARSGLDWRAVSHLFYTHYHPDHSLDLVSYLFASNYAPPEPRGKPLTLIGPVGLEDFYNNILSTWPSVAPKGYELIICELAHADKLSLPDGWHVRCAAMDHGSSGGLGYRIERGGRALVLSGDTQYCAELAWLALGADLLVVECSGDEANQVEGHMTPSQVARIVSEAAVDNLLINHVYPPLSPETLAEECAKLSGARVEPAADLRSYEV